MRFFAYTYLSLLLLTQVCLAFLDANGNGMSDVWERKYRVVGANPIADLDGDGQSNLLESLAGTNPNDANSVFNLVESEYKPSAVVLNWQSVEGVLYWVQSTSNLLSPNWTNVGSKMVGTGGVMSAAFDKGGDLSCFYRVVTVSENSVIMEQALMSLQHDTDGDGQSDLSEIKSGTDPFSSSSYLHLRQFRFGPSVKLTWKTELGKRYQIESRGIAPGSEWENEGMPYHGNGGSLTVALSIPASGQRYYSVRVEDVDTDGDGVDDWEEIQVGLDIGRSKTNALGDGDLVELQTRLAANNVVVVSAQKAVANITRMEEGGFEVTRSGGVDELTVNYSITGSAVAGSDYQTLTGAVTIPFGENSVVIPVQPIASSSLSLTRSVVLTLGDGHNYALGNSNTQQVNVLKEVALNVMDYGAIGDGVADDTLAIQAALDALEASTTHNTLYFPQGRYRLNQIQWDTNTVTTTYRLISLGSSDLSGRDIILKGDDGAVLYSTVSPIRAHMLVVFASFRSLSCYGMSWEKDNVPLSEKPYGVEPNGADGISLVATDLRVVEHITLNHCNFINCHGAMTITANGYDRRGNLKKLEFYDCKFLNPYGANTINSRLAWGGGQQTYLSPWVGTAIYQRNLFEGGGDDLSDQNTSPGGRLKDAAVLGSPLRLIFTDNTVRRMGVEAVSYAGSENWMNQIEDAIMVPPPDGTTSVVVKVGNYPSTFIAGQSILMVSPTTPTVASKVNVFRVVAYDSSTRMLTFVNDGLVGNAPEGTALPKHTSIQLNDATPNPKSYIMNNVMDGRFPPGADPSSYSIGIMMKTNALVKNNFIQGFIVGVMSYDALIPHPGSVGLTIDSNIILTANRLSHGSRILGIRSWAPDQLISNNIIITPSSTRFVGISLEGNGAHVRNNYVIPMLVERHSYTSAFRSVGIGVGNPSSNVESMGNYTYGLDVGIGPESANQIIPHRVISHHSVNDTLPIDHRGLIE